MQEAKNRGWFGKFLRFVEWAGNLLPHPVALFALLCVGVVLFSAICQFFGLEVMDPRPKGAKGRVEDGLIAARSLLSPEGIRWMITHCVKNFTNFAPLGTVLVAMLGVGVAEASGLLTTAIRSLVLVAPQRLITPVLVLAGVLSNVASEMGYVVMVPMGGFIFLALGRHPLAGMAAVFAGVSGGYSSNVLISTLDPLLAGITQEAAQLIKPDYTVHAAVNWYFMASSSFIVTLLGWWITERIVEPNLGHYNPEHGDLTETNTNYLAPLTTAEKKGLKWAAMVILGLAAIVAVCLVPEQGLLRDPATGSVLRSAALKGVVTLLLVFFLVPSVVYGYVVGKFKSIDDVIEGMSQAMRGLALYIVLVFFAAQFIEYFKWTHLGFITAVTGADFLKSIGLTGTGVFIPFILLCAFINLCLGSASAQWAVTAPVFVPMLMLLGYSPEVIQAAYRIGDSTTNIITPMMPYFGLILAFAHRFDKRLGIGTIVSTMVPYSIAFMIGWTVWFYLWVFVFKLPVGPGAATYL